MKKKRLNIALGIVAFSLLLGGCGTQMHALTEDEEDLIVQYAAHIVSKYNIRQTDGMTSVLPSETEEDKDSQQKPDTESTETETDSENNQNGNQSDEPSDVKKGVALEEALGYEGITARFIGSETSSSYQEGNAYSIDAATGKVFYVIKYELSNSTEEAIQINNVQLNPTFVLVGEDISVKAEITVLTEDLSTYVGEIKSGETIKTVLLFEVSESKAEAMQQAELKVIIGEETKSIEL